MSVMVGNVSIQLPASVELIGVDAFHMCNSLLSVEAPGVTRVGVYAFCMCGSLTSVRLPSLTTIGIAAFLHCHSLMAIDLPASVTAIPADPIIVRQNWLRAYEFTTDRGAAALNDFARANDPFTRVGRQQIAVEVSSVIRASPGSFRVAWTERHYENGQLSTTERWTAILTVVIQTPRSADANSGNSRWHRHSRAWERHVRSNSGATWEASR